MRCAAKIQVLTPATHGGTREGSGRPLGVKNRGTARRHALARTVHDVVLARLISVREQDQRTTAPLLRAVRSAARDLETYASNPLLDVAQLAPPHLDEDDAERLLGVLFGVDAGGARSRGQGARRVAGELTSRLMRRRDDWYRREVERGRALSPVRPRRTS